VKKKSALPTRYVDPILQDIYTVKASLNRKAKFDLPTLSAQVRTESAQRRRGSRQAA